MPNSKISFLYKYCQNGSWFLFALLLVAISWACYCPSMNQMGPQIIAAFFIFYFAVLLIHKYFHFWPLFASLIVLFLLLIKHDSDLRQTHFEQVKEVKIEPDQIKVKDNWLSGIGTVQGKKLLLAGSVSPQQKKILQQGQALILTKIEGETEEIMPATNLGEFDFRQYYDGKNINQRLTMKNFELQNCRQNYCDYGHHLRFSLQRVFKKMPRLLGFFAGELILAENNRGQEQTVTNNYRDLGIIHLLSISGLHVGLYTLLISSLCFWLKFDQEEAFICCALVLAAGIFLSAGQAGFVRASLTYFLRHLLRKSGLRVAEADVLGLTCIIHLLIVPHLFLGTGAILSYLLAGGLQMTASMSNFKQAVALNALITPLLLFYFYQINLLTVAFNIFLVPYFNYFVMPVSLLNLCLPNLRPLLEKMLETSEGLIARLAQTKMGLLTFGQINWWQCLILLISSCLCIILLNEKKLQRKQINILLTVLASFYLMIFASIHFPLRGQVTLIDVGQGDSILITTPLKRKVYMIDTGGKLNFSGKKQTPQVNQITLPLLRAQGISKIDGLFVTHQDADHVGDVSALLDQIEIKRLYTAKGLIRNPSFKKRLDGHLKETQLVELLAGMNVQDKGINFEVLSPYHAGTGKNEDSLCLSFCLQKKRWLFTGDLGQDGEKELLLHYPQLKVDYFKLGHHGSKTASNPDFLRKIAPRLTFVSAGRHNRFGHPHPQTLATLKKEGIPWVSTQDCGMISWYYDCFNHAFFQAYLRR